jgi:hypothetical protein
MSSHQISDNHLDICFPYSLIPFRSRSRKWDISIRSVLPQPYKWNSRTTPSRQIMSRPRCLYSTWKQTPSSVNNYAGCSAWIGNLNIRGNEDEICSRSPLMWIITSEE